MQTGKGEKSENNARIGGMLHTEFLLKIFIYMLFCDYFKIIFLSPLPPVSQTRLKLVPD